MSIKRFVAIVASLLLVAPLIAAVDSAVAPVSKAEAANGSLFEPGNIISDSLFFDGFAMSTAEVQAFLTSKEAPCASGATCAYNGTLRTPSMAAESGLCNAYSGAQSESVASVIARVGQACGISQKVLLVLIQKEQRLITSSDPTQWMFAQATGFGCPDTAPCDAAYGGFFYQVWYAARQFKMYAKYPSWYNHLPGRVNNVRYSTIASCGTLAVYIENQATAGLYNYTPYTPNAASLANMYGEGDGCSTYGNRNFWSIYTDWFGSTTGQSAIAKLHQQLGGDAGVLGPAQSGVEIFTGNGGGRGQRFLNGSIMSSPTAGTFALMNGAIRTNYFAWGGPSSAMGWPTTAQLCVSSVCTQAFQGGVIPDAISALHVSLGGNVGALGPAQSGYQSFTGRGGGTGQRFLGGSVMWNAATGAIAVMNGGIRNQYFDRGGPAGTYGWPTAAQVCSVTSCSQVFQGGTITDAIGALQASLGGDTGAMGPAQSGMEYFTGSGGGTGQRFLNGSIMSSPTVGTFAIMNGAIRDQYFGSGGPSGTYGWPTGSQTCTGSACSQAFQGGMITDAIGSLYTSLGGASGALGAVMTGIQNFTGAGGGTGQRFVNGSIMSSPTAGTFAIMNGAIRDQYFGSSGPSGSYGWPVAAQVCSGDTCSQAFQGGTISDAIGGLYASMGGSTGALGPVLTGLQSFSGAGGGTGQRFQNGSIMSSPTAGTFAIMNGAIRDKYFGSGGPSGTYGWPVAAQVCSGSSCSQAFQGGTISK